MSAHAYTEEHLVEQPVIQLFKALGWAVAGPPPNTGVAGEPRDAGLLSRETKGELVLVSRLRPALERVKKELGRYDLPPDKTDELLDRLQVLQTTDMALIVSPGQNEIERMKKHGLDIVPHRKPFFPLADCPQRLPHRGSGRVRIFYR